MIRHRRRGFRLGAGVAFALLVAACAGEPADVVAVGGGDTPDVPELDWTEPLLGGGTVDGTSYAGRDLVIWFYAPT